MAAACFAFGGTTAAAAEAELRPLVSASISAWLLDPPPRRLLLDPSASKLSCFDRLSSTLLFASRARSFSSRPAVPTSSAVKPVVPLLPAIVLCFFVLPEENMLPEQQP